MKRLTGILLLSLFLSTGLIFYVSADGSNHSANFLIQTGIREMEKGRYNQAASEFSKALMIQPNNREARYYLNQLGFEEGLYNGAISDQDEISNLKQHLRYYKEKTAQLEKEKWAIEQKFRKLQAKSATHENDYFDDRIDDFIEYNDHLYHSGEKFSRFKKEATNTYAHQDKLIDVLEDYLTVREDHLENAKDEQVFKELELAWTSSLLVDTMDELAEINEAHDHMIQDIDGRSYWVNEEDDYAQYLKRALHQSREDELFVEQDLIHSQSQVLRLLQERADKIEAMKKEVDFLRQ